MGTASRMHSHDTYVVAAKPNTNFYGSARLGVKQSMGSNTQEALVHFSRPFRPGVKIQRAILAYHTHQMPENVAHTMQVARVTDKVNYSTVTWSTRPSVDTATMLSQTKSGPLPSGQEWRWDVTAMVQEWSDGAPMYGFRISTSESTQRWIFAEETTAVQADGPTLWVEWADNPDEPQSLFPNEVVVSTNKPMLTYEYVDISGDVQLTKAHVQISTSPTFVTVDWDSGERNVSTPNLSLTQMGYPGATAGVKTYYRIRVMDGDTLWSNWSSVAWFIYKAQSSATLIAPDPAAPLFGDSTPQIAWNMPNQTAYQVAIAGVSDPSRFFWNTHKVTSTQNVIEVPKDVLRWDNGYYRLIVRLWDDEPRGSVPGAPAYREFDLNVQFASALGTGAVDWVQAEQVGQTPRVRLTWDRATAADAFEVVRRTVSTGAQVLVGRLDFEDTVQPDGTFAWEDVGCPPNTDVKYLIYPIADGRRQAGRWTDEINVPLEAIWLVTPTHTLVINGDDQGTFELPESATVFHPIGSDEPVVIREPHRGYDGSLSGLLIEEEKYQPHLSAQQKYETFLAMKSRPEGARLIVANLNIPVALSEMNAYPTPFYDLRFICSFNFAQRGEVWWDVA